MKTYYNTMFLMLPIATTIANLLFAFGISSLHNKVSAEVITTTTTATTTASVGSFPQQQNGQETADCKWEAGVASKSNSSACSNNDDGIENDDDDEEDPMLLPMPTPHDPNFKAYVRGDISSFYQEPVGSRKEQTPAYTGMAGKFINISPNRVTLYWEDEYNRTYFISNVGPWEAGGSASYPGHKWFFANPKDPNDILCRFVIEPGTSIYYYDPYTSKEDDVMMKLQPQSRGVYDDTTSKHQLSSNDKEIYDQHRYNLVFGVQYKNFTNGQEWLSMYPRPKPLHKMWRADYFGQEHHIQTKETQFIDVPPRESWQDSQQQQQLLQQEQRRLGNDGGDARVMYEEYRKPDIMNITIKALSVAPRAFEIRNFLSDVEVDHILELVNLKNLPKSSTGNLYNRASNSANLAKIENTRTSRNTWLTREASPILDAVYRRVADVLRLDEALFRRRLPNEIKDGGKYNETIQKTTNPISEQLQVVHYDVGEEYTAHHDFGYIDGIKDKPSRSINLCMYLNEGMEGGQTSFPRWRNAETNEPINVVPEKGKAMIFYMVTPDGNLDDLTQHAALPVISGEKWFANLWIWDPFKP